MKKLFELSVPLSAFICCLFFVSVAEAQTYWGTMGGGLTIEEATSVALDPSQNTVATGYFTGSAVFQGQTLNSAGLSDIFVAKYNPGGTLMWAVRLGGVSNERATSVACDNFGNIFITGYFYGTFTAGAQTLTSTGQQDVFLIKMNPAGQVVWARRGGGTQADIANDVAVDNTGAPVIIGQYSGTATFGATSITGQAEDVFVTKYDSAGTVQWVKNGTAPAVDRGFAVSCDQNNNVVATGQFSQTITFDVTHPNTSNNSVFVIKFNAAGAEQWFRIIGGATSNISNDIGCDNSGNVYVTGDFTGNLFFFPNLGVPLTNPYPNRIFVAKYDPQGSLLWSEADGSSSEISSKAIAVGTNSFYITGYFKCKFSEYADQYGQGTFNSVGYKDCFASQYNLSGSRQWARQWGGKKDDESNSVSVRGTTRPVFAGSFECNLNIPATGSGSFFPAGILNSPNQSGTCGDNNYNIYNAFMATGNKDVFIGGFVDPSRQPYDYYHRTSTACNLPFVGGCINNNTGDHTSCLGDSVTACGNVVLHASTQTGTDTAACAGVGPNYNYQWSSGATADNINVITSGYRSVVQTTEDGCFSSSDTIYVNIKPLPPKPAVSDNQGVNSHDIFPDEVRVCLPAQVVLSADPQPGVSISWQGGTPGSNTFTAPATGVYFVTSTGANGCTSQTAVSVVYESTLQPIDPQLFLMGDADGNDSITVCGNMPVYLGIFDMIANPAQLPATIPNLNGSCTFLPSGTFGNVVDVPPFLGYSYVSAILPQSDTYICNCSFEYYNSCDTLYYTVSDTFYVDVLPYPQVDVEITGPSALCPGQVGYYGASGGTNYVWYALTVYNNGFDTIGVNSTQLIYVASFETSANGCSASDFDTLSVTVVSQPVLTVNPSSGVICPNDSVQLVCSGPGLVQWFGPGGMLSDTTHSIYVTTPGSYYCNVIFNSGCTLLTNTIVITEFSSPFLTTSKPPLICAENDSVQISVVVSGQTSIQWVNPPGATGTSVYVSDSGWYFCQVQSQCGTLLTDSIYVQVNDPKAQILDPLSNSLCAGDTIVLYAQQGPYTYVWQPGGSAADSLVVIEEGSYNVTITDTLGCKNQSADILIDLINDDDFVPDATDVPFCAPGAVEIYASGNGTISWYASETDTTALFVGNPYITPVLQQTSVFYLDLSTNGCYGKKIAVIAEEMPCDSISVPNVFTPNGDGINDYIDFSLFGLTCFEIYIYNRWGELVFDSQTINTIWYGQTNHNTQLVAGAYYYILKYCPQDSDAKEQKGIFHIFK